MIAYFNGTYLDKGEIRVSPDDRAFLFADSLYEAVRSYRGRLFRLKDHLDRLGQGAQFLNFRETDFSFLKPVAEELLRKNNLYGRNAVLYFQVSRGSTPKRTHAFPDPGVGLTIYATASALDTKGLNRDMETGIRVITVPDQRWANCHIKTTGLLANALASEQARQAGAREAVFVRDNRVLEGSHSNFFMVVDGSLATAPLSNRILPGITRKVVLEVCRESDIPVQERAVEKNEMCLATEMFVTATSMQVTPVVSFDGEMVGRGMPGPVTRKLQALFETVVDRSE
ncbi:MAG: aminotransferase class IV [Desulfobacterales bacterium]|nr:aminotransferase class IV [Desulfobacterales bacterium]